MYLDEQGRQKTHRGREKFTNSYESRNHRAAVSFNACAHRKPPTRGLAVVAEPLAGGSAAQRCVRPPLSQ